MEVSIRRPESTSPGMPSRRPMGVSMEALDHDGFRCVLRFTATRTSGSIRESGGHCSPVPEGAGSPSGALHGRDRLLHRHVAGDDLEGLADRRRLVKRAREDGGDVVAAYLAAADALADLDTTGSG